MGRLNVNMIEENPNKLTTTRDVNGKHIPFHFDTSAMCDVIPFKKVEKMKITKWVKPVSTPLRSYSRHVIKPVGQVALPVKFK